MPSQKNIDQLTVLKDKFASAKSIVFANYAGLNVANQTVLRSLVKNAGGEFTISKNNLIKLALKDHLDSLSGDMNKALDGPTAILFSNKDTVSALKILVKFAKDHDLPEVKIGLIDGKVITLEEINHLATLPGKDELIVMLIGQLNAPTHGLVNVLRGNLRGLIQVIKSMKENKQAN